MGDTKLPEHPYMRRDGPVHGWFGLTYSSYLVLPRLVLSSMPLAWQERWVGMLNELRDEMGHHCEVSEYRVNALGDKGRFIKDPLRDYRRGPTLTPKSEER